MADEKVSIPKREFIQEHDHLLEVLKNPAKAKLEAEYREQKEELEKVKGAALPEGDLASIWANDFIRLLEGERQKQAAVRDYTQRLERLRERRQDPPGSPMHEFMSADYGSVDEVLAAYRRMQERKKQASMDPAIDLQQHITRALGDYRGGAIANIADDIAMRAGREAPTREDVAHAFFQHIVPVRYQRKAAADKPTVFLGGKVSGPDGNWREEIKDDLKEKGVKPIDPKVPAKEWKPETHIYKEIKQMLTADKVVFHKGGFFTKKEKELCDAVGKTYTILKKPADALKVASVMTAEAKRLLSKIEPRWGGVVSDLVEGKARAAAGAGEMTEKHVQDAWRKHGRNYLWNEGEIDMPLPEKIAAYSAPVAKGAIAALHRYDQQFGRPVTDSIVARAHQLAMERGEDKATLGDVLASRQLYASEHLSKMAKGKDEVKSDDLKNRVGAIAARTAGTAVVSHVGLNAALMAKDKYAPHTAQKSMNAAVMHALHGRIMRPSIHEGLGLVAGFETVGSEYDMAHKLTERVMGMKFVKGDPVRAAKVLNRLGKSKALRYMGTKNHVFGNLQATLSSLDPASVGTYKPNRLMTVAKSELTPEKARVGRRVAQGVAAAASVLHPDLAVGPAINKVRQLAGQSQTGQKTVKDLLVKGVREGKMNTAKKFGISLAMSPAMGQLQDMGAAVGDIARDRFKPSTAAKINEGLLNSIGKVRNAVGKARDVAQVLKRASAEPTLDQEALSRAIARLGL